MCWLGFVVCHRLISNLPYPADSEGMLIGGWWRRLLAAVSGRLGSSGDRHIRTQLDEPSLPLPPGLMYETGTTYDMAASSAQKPASKPRRGLMSYWADGPTQHAFWDSHRRFKHSLSYVWEPNCLESECQLTCTQCDTFLSIHAPGFMRIEGTVFMCVLCASLHAGIGAPYAILEAEYGYWISTQSAAKVCVCVH